MIDLHYGYSMITERFVDRYPTIDDFKALITAKLTQIDDTGKLAFDTTLDDAGWKLIYFSLYKLFKNTWFKSIDGELRDLRIADKIYHEYPRIQFERTVEAKLITQTDLDRIMTARVIQNSAQAPAVEPSTDSDEILGYINAQSVGTQQNSIADLVNTSFTNRSARVEKWAQGFKNMFVMVFTAGSAPYFTGVEVTNDD